MAENKTVDRAEREANHFAEVARKNPANVVTVEVEDSRLYPSANLQRTFAVRVEQPAYGRATTARWTADVEPPLWGRRSVKFFGWASSVISLKSEKISLGMCYIRVRSY